MANLQTMQITPTPSHVSPTYNPEVFQFLDIDAEVEIDLSHSSGTCSSTADDYSSDATSSSATLDGDNLVDDIATIG
jgi:hypothetical protein